MRQTQAILATVPLWPQACWAVTVRFFMSHSTYETSSSLKSLSKKVAYSYSFFPSPSLLGILPVAVTLADGQEVNEKFLYIKLQIIFVYEFVKGNGEKSLLKIATFWNNKY